MWLTEGKPPVISVLTFVIFSHWTLLAIAQNSSRTSDPLLSGYSKYKPRYKHPGNRIPFTLAELVKEKVW